jgi:hypothetical protein
VKDFLFILIVLGACLIIGAFCVAVDYIRRRWMHDDIIDELVIGSRQSIDSLPSTLVTLLEKLAALDGVEPGQLNIETIAADWVQKYPNVAETWYLRLLESRIPGSTVVATDNSFKLS